MTPIEDHRDAAIVVLARVICLMGAELVTGRHHDDVDQFAAAVRQQVRAMAVGNCIPEVAEAGAAPARCVVEAALGQIRAQWLTARAASEKPNLPPSKMNWASRVHTTLKREQRRPGTCGSGLASSSSLMRPKRWMMC